MPDARLRFACKGLRCIAAAGEPLEVSELRGLVEILEDHLLEANDVLKNNNEK
jgi:hypothetical protein